MKPIVFTLLFIGLIPISTYAQVFGTNKGYAEFESKASIESFKGISRNLTGQLSLAESTLDFYLDLNTIATGITLRDRQMRENYLETAKFPFAEFIGKFYNAVDLSSRQPQQVYVLGNFTIHGVTKEIELVATLTPMSNGRLKASAAWPLKLSDYDIDVPSLLFYRLNEVLNLSVQMELTRAQ